MVLANAIGSYSELPVSLLAIGLPLLMLSTVLATYLGLMVKPMGIAVTRLASGLPVGGDLEYADEITLGRAFEGRRAI